MCNFFHKWYYPLYTILHFAFLTWIILEGCPISEHKEPPHCFEQLHGMSLYVCTVIPYLIPYWWTYRLFTNYIYHLLIIYELYIYYNKLLPKYIDTKLQQKFIFSYDFFHQKFVKDSGGQFTFGVSQEAIVRSWLRPKSSADSPGTGGSFLRLLTCIAGKLVPCVGWVPQCLSTWTSPQRYQSITAALSCWLKQVTRST